MDAKEFKREDRYAVIKYKKLTSTQWTKLPTMLDSFASACVDCVVIEKDWPEYNFVWLMIEHRMAGFPVPDFNAVKCAADVAIAEQRLADAERRNAVYTDLLSEVLNEVPHGWGESFSDSELAERIHAALNPNPEAASHDE